MIVKSIGAKGSGSYGRLIDYVLRDGAALRDKEGRLVTIRYNVFGSPQEIELQFRENEARRLHHRANNNALLHTILSLSGKNNGDITPEMLERLSLEYIRMVDPDCLAYGAIHMGGNPHAHILISGSNMLGYSTRVSREEFQRIKQELQAMQMRDYPELADSVVEHGGGHMKRSEAEYQIERAGRQTRKEQLKEIISVSHDLAGSREEFFDLLAQDGLTVYERGGEIKGIRDEGRSYRFQTVGADLAELDKRAERLAELETTDGDKHLDYDMEQESQDAYDGGQDESMPEERSIEEDRMRELDELEQL